MWGDHVHLDRPRQLVPDMTVVRCRGELPSVAGMFGLLRVFNATRNLLTGSIPRQFGAAGIFTLVSLVSRKCMSPQGKSTPHFSVKGRRPGEAHNLGRR